MSFGRSEDTADVLAEQDRDAVPGPGGDLGPVPSGVQPHRQGGVPQVIGAPGQPVGGDFGAEGENARGRSARCGRRPIR
jgi:hypothetical protein